MSDALIDDLKREIASGRCVAIVGAGVSIFSTDNAPAASWTGLLHHGVQRCVEVARALPSGWAERAKGDIDSGGLKGLLSAAGKVSDELGAPDSGEYSRWLRESVGALQLRNPEVLQALKDLGVTLATTNYDSLIEDVTRLRPVTWMDGRLVERVLRGDDKGVLHLHGHWESPESVILGIRSYDKVLGSDLAQALQQAMTALKTICFVGCGEGLDDPNFGALLEWTGKVFAGSEYRRFLLTRTSEVERLKKDHPPEQRLFVIDYGANFSDLAPFLRRLGTAVKSTSSPSGSGTTASIPGLSPLPPKELCFGRNEQMAELVAALLEPRPQPIPIMGGPGIGKTNLISAAAHDGKVAARYGARRIFVRCDGLRSRPDLAAAIGASVGLTPGKDNEPALLAELGRAPTLLILDNAETPWEADYLPVEELLGRLGDISDLALVLTIRGSERPAGPAWRDPSFQPKRLSLAPARELFLSVAGRRLANDPRLDPLLSAIDYVPLAIRLLAHLAESELDLEGLGERWLRERTAMLQRVGGKERITNIEVSYELSWSGRRMDDQGRRLLRLLALLPAGVARADLQAVHPEGTQAAAILRKTGLAFDDEAGRRLRVLAPLREYVGRHYPPEDEDLERLIAHYVALAQKEGSQVGGLRGSEAVIQLTAEAPNIEAMLVRGVEGKSSPAVIRAIPSWVEFMRFTGLGLTETVERATEAARRSGDPVSQANCIKGLADIALARSDLERARARYEEARPLYRQVDHVLGEANCIQGLGDIALTRSDHNEARGRYEEARLLYRQAGNVHGEANCITGLGDIALARSDHKEARERYEEARPLYRQVGNVHGEANCIMGLGDIALARSDHKEARERYEEARPLYRQVGNVLGEASCIQGLGDIALARSDHKEARERYEEARPLYRQVGNVLGEANCIKGLGDIALARSDHKDARARYEEARPLYRQVGNVPGEANCIMGLGDIALARSDHKDARERYEEARPLYRQVGEVRGEGNCHFGIARSHMAQASRPEAAAQLRAALACYKRHGDPYPIGAAHFLLAQVCEGAEREPHRQAARAAWRRLDPEALTGMAALDGIDPSELDSTD